MLVLPSAPETPLLLDVLNRPVRSEYSSGERPRHELQCAGGEWERPNNRRVQRRFRRDAAHVAERVVRAPSTV
eukprot:5903002-Pleurochrysis_carterae.AAC.4